MAEDKSGKKRIVRCKTIEDVVASLVRTQHAQVILDPEDAARKSLTGGPTSESKQVWGEINSALRMSKIPIVRVNEQVLIVEPH